MIRFTEFSAKICNRFTLRYCINGAQRPYSTTMVNTKDADEWIATLDDETRAEVIQVQNQVS